MVTPGWRRPDVMMRPASIPQQGWLVDAISCGLCLQGYLRALIKLLLPEFWNHLLGLQDAMDLLFCHRSVTFHFSPRKAARRPHRFCTCMVWSDIKIGLLWHHGKSLFSEKVWVWKELLMISISSSHWKAFAQGVPSNLAHSWITSTMQALLSHLRISSTECSCMYIKAGSSFM